MLEGVSVGEVGGGEGESRGGGFPVFGAGGISAIKWGSFGLRARYPRKIPRRGKAMPKPTTSSTATRMKER